MNSKQSGIYSITSKINGKRYIGCSNRICTRWKEHKTYLRNNKHHSIHLQNHYNKYGEDDLIFSVVEIVERGDLNLQEFKDLLLNKEQQYLNNWKECEFNCLKIAGSPLGYKRSGSRYYTYNKKDKTYKVTYVIEGRLQYFSCFFLEEDAIKEVEYIKTLSEKDLIEYQKECKNRQKSKTKRGSKNYQFSKQTNKWMVIFRINGKNKTFGYFESEQEAIKKSTEIKLKLGYL